MSHFADRLSEAIRARNSRVCVGLDPVQAHLPRALAAAAEQGPDEAAQAVGAFCCAILDAVAPYAAVVKPQAAYFEALGPAGYRVLWDVMAYAHGLGLPVILDAKRSDIGSTAAAYAAAYFDPPAGLVGPDALTVNPYLGSDGVLPFIEAGGPARGVYVLVKTSNPSSGELQDLRTATPAGPRVIYRQLGERVAQWGEASVGDYGYSSVGAVVGATYPEQLAELRAWLPTVPFLVPGYGAQGGAAADVAGAFDSRGLGAVVNSSRGIIYAGAQEPYASSDDPDAFAAAAAEAARIMRDDINSVLGLLPPPSG
jgi:orotidine-5'-phosphate decarboxylase